MHSWQITEESTWPRAQQMFGLEAQMTGLINTLRSRQIGHHYTDGILKRIFLNENVSI